MQAREATFARFAAKPRGRIHSHAAWAAMLADLDAGVGRLLAEVERLGLAETTYVILTADNGAAEFVPPVKNKMDPPSVFPVPPRNHPLRGGKWVLYEGGIRVPLVVRGPGVAPGSRCDVPVAGWDLLPTLADLAGYRDPLPGDLDGGSFRALLRDGTGSVRRSQDDLVFHRYAAGYPHSAIRVGDHKLIKLWKSGALELYNLRADPGETMNLAQREPAMTRELHDRLMAYLRRVDAEVLTGYGRPGAED
jgi:arylsulfatase A-like enzyme